MRRSRALRERWLSTALLLTLAYGCAGVAPTYPQPETVPTTLRPTTINIEAMRQVSQAVMVGVRPRRVYFLMPRLRWTLETVVWVGKPLQLTTRTTTYQGTYGGLTTNGDLMLFERHKKAWVQVSTQHLLDIVEPRSPRLWSSIALGGALGLGFGALTGALPPPGEERTWARVGLWSGVGVGLGIGFGALFGWLSGGDKHYQMAGAETYRRLVIRRQIWPAKPGAVAPEGAMR
ncbi:MAG: hypothetical protein VX589_13190 [Myxococcota bacterium]|nr:hypothetical protein [Myxococcota bacterium]